MKKKAVLWLVALMCVLPFCLMIIGSLKLGGGVTLQQYGMILLQTPQFFIGLWNSVLYTAVILLVNLPISLLAAYGFSRFHFCGRDLLFWLYIVMMLMPFQATVVPQYLTLKWLGIINSPWAVVLPNIFATFGTFLMTQYMRGFDKSLYEAAQIDGMGSFGIFRRLVLPICKPVISAMAVLSFVNYWSLVEQPTMFLEKASQQPLSVRLGGFTFGEIAFAAGVIFSILPLLLYLYSYEDLQNGISLTANGGGGVAEKIKLNKRGKLAKRLGMGFVLAMLVFSFATQKVFNIMMPQVSVYTVERRAPVLAEFKVVVPESCISQGAGGLEVFIVMPSSFDGVSQQAIATSVEVQGRDGGYCAVSGIYQRDAVIVCHRSRTVNDGDLVKIVGEAFYEEAAQ